MPVSPPVARLPSLNALRAFEAAARLGGFALAAEELNVTPGAVAAQIKALEDDLGAPLFERHPRGVRLTPLGQNALPGFVAAFDKLGQTTRDLQREARPRRIHIAALPALAQLWLAPRLPELRTKLAGHDISVTAMEKPPNLKRAPFDLCLFYGVHVPKGGVRLAGDALLPVCAPDIGRTLHRVEDLQTARRLADAVWTEDWATWARAAAPGLALAPNGPVFSLYALAVEETLAGAGVLMAHRSLVAHHLASGALVAPVGRAVPLPASIMLWMHPGGRAMGGVNAVVSALLDLAT